ncbi:preprotein translocase subunit TatB [Solwaraspora sp. WMMB335]|uniref:preprotein translocase subunit TatB n=1 Tax=Solwaraspora sp. WMMB335 TaxID=3404118 RepID=UPI003B930E8C
MFDNLNGWEFGLLLLLALLIFGDRLPQVISDGLRMVRNLRNMARNATSDLSRELGTDIQLEDLHPKAFIRKHLLSEEDEAALRKPLQGVYDDLRKDVGGVQDELRDVAAAADLRSGTKATAAAKPVAANGPATAGTATGGAGAAGAAGSAGSAGSAGATGSGAAVIDAT